MKEALQDKLVDVLSTLHTAVLATQDFALEHLPEIAQQYVLVGRAQSALCVVCALIPLMFGGWAIRKCLRTPKVELYGREVMGRMPRPWGLPVRRLVL